MQPTEVIRAWGRILAGYKPFLSVELTRECPLRCPGCYAYDPQHLGDGRTLRDLSDYRGQALIDGVLQVVDELRPLHLSIVGGDPLVRYREVEQLLPELVRRDLYIQFVTSAFRPIPPTWAGVPRLNLVVSVDGLQPEHDVRRRPATYERILSNIAGHRVSIHCTVTAQMMHRPTYLEEFLQFWTPRAEVRRIWFSAFTPQLGDTAVEILSPAQRAFLVTELLQLRPHYSKLDMREEMIREFAQPPRSPGECIFAQTTATISADLKTRITPCQFGGKPDCSQCGCIASMGLASLGHKQVVPGLTLGGIMHASTRIGTTVQRARMLARNTTWQLSSTLSLARSRWWARPKSKSQAA